MTPDFGILVLAAGKSQRFGSDKLIAKMDDNQPMIAHSLKPLLSLSKEHNLELCVITRPDNKLLIDFLKHEKINYSLCPNAYLGMGHSIAHGIKTNPLWQGWMIALADMPNLTANIVETLITHIIQSPHQIVRPSILKKDKEIPLHPVYFPQSYKFKLSELTGDNGAKNIIQQQKLINISNANLLIDIDTTADLFNLKL
jgi:molybdenum cofactor cytidylyltransferase